MIFLLACANEVRNELPKVENIISNNHVDKGKEDLYICLKDALGDEVDELYRLGGEIVINDAEEEIGVIYDGYEVPVPKEEVYYSRTQPIYETRTIIPDDDLIPAKTLSKMDILANRLRDAYKNLKGKAKDKIKSIVKGKKVQKGLSREDLGFQRTVSGKLT